jgi:hypothetical protein
MLPSSLGATNSIVQKNRMFLAPEEGRRPRGVREQQVEAGPRACPGRPRGAAPTGRIGEGKSCPGRDSSGFYGKSELRMIWNQKNHTINTMTYQKTLLKSCGYMSKLSHE